MMDVGRWNVEIVLVDVSIIDKDGLRRGDAVAVALAT